MLVRMTEEYEESLVGFLYKYNNQKEYSVAWVPENYSEIVAYDKSSFILCVENNEIVGCLGAYVSEEQEIARLLGPIIIKEYCEKYVEEMYEQFLRNLPKNMKELRIAFFVENELCKNWCDKKGFEHYNAEKTIVYSKENYIEVKSQSTVKLVPYEEKYKASLSLVHPTGTFFTLEELISQINSNHHIMLSIDDNEVTGYIYYEITEDKDEGEIVLLHVREGKRGKGHGSLLLRETIKELINSNVKQISTSVRVTNYEAQKLYKRMGFVDKETVYAYKKYLR